MNRIPHYQAGNPDGMLLWFAEMSALGLLFHPEEDPASIVEIVSGKELFTASEAHRTREILNRMHIEHGDAMIEACYPIFMRAAGQRLDS